MIYLIISNLLLFAISIYLYRSNIKTKKDLEDQENANGVLEEQIKILANRDRTSTSDRLSEGSF